MQVAISVLCTTIIDYAKQESTAQKQNRLAESAKVSWQLYPYKYMQSQLL